MGTFFPKCVKQSDDRIRDKYSNAYHREVMINPWPHLKSDFSIKQTNFSLKKADGGSPLPHSHFESLPNAQGKQAVP